MKLNTKAYEEKMQKAIAAYENNLAVIRAGQANTAVLSRVSFEYYGSMTPINTMADIRVADAKTVTITPYDATTLKAMEKAILASDVGITPNSDGKMLRLIFPQPTEERRKELSALIDECQRVFGKTFNSYDTGIVAGLVDQLGFEEEAVLAMLAYVTRIGKKGLRYSEKLALSFYDEGITTAAAVVERIALIEHSSEVISKIKQLFGIGARELSKTEKALFEKWTQKFGYGIEVIRVAYDITVDATQKPLPKYADAILEKWHAEGLRTEEEVLAFETNSKQEREGASGGDKSYELDDFFEAALKRSLEDLK